MNDTTAPLTGVRIMAAIRRAPRAVRVDPAVALQIGGPDLEDATAIHFARLVAREVGRFEPLTGHRLQPTARRSPAARFEDRP